MANIYYGINRGNSEYSAAVSASTTGKEVEIVVNGTNVTDKQSLIVAVQNLENFILKNGYPPV